MGYAMVMGEALIDLLEAEAGGEQIYRQAIGGAPLNVAVGVARLGGAVEYAGALGADVLGERMAAFLREAGVGVGGVKRVGAPTTLAVTTFEGAEPTFTFYGEPPSYALLGPDDLDRDVVAGASVLYAGSICLLREPFRSAAREAWRVAGLASGDNATEAGGNAREAAGNNARQAGNNAGQAGGNATEAAGNNSGPVRVFDPNVRPTLLPDADAVDALRTLVEEFFATADLVKLSIADAIVLYGEADPAVAAERIRNIGAKAVVVTCGSKGAYIATEAGGKMIPAPRVDAVDATGAGDSVMGALISRLLRDGAGETDWERHVTYALAVAGLVCERPGGATAMPTAAEVEARWGLGG
jgi:fructokinase